MHSDANAEASLLILRREGRAYAEALTCHTNAAMAWLTYLDRYVFTSDKPDD